MSEGLTRCQAGSKHFTQQSIAFSQQPYEAHNILPGEDTAVGRRRLTKVTEFEFRFSPQVAFTASGLDVTGATLEVEGTLLLLSHGKQTSCFWLVRVEGHPSGGWMSGIL